MYGISTAVLINYFVFVHFVTHPEPACEVGLDINLINK